MPTVAKKSTPKADKRSRSKVMGAKIHSKASAKSVISSASKTMTRKSAKSGAILLSAKDQELFAEALLTPATEIPDAIKQVAEHHKRLIISR